MKEGEADYARFAEEFGRGAVDALCKKGAIEIEERKIARSPFSGLPENYEKRLLQKPSRTRLTISKIRINAYILYTASRAAEKPKFISTL